ncbi:uncharacterized protein LOC135119874 [Zophobas morio]|uniref:uncharacterized protein LOC135119874 n=1 Tax=Zophobas morio TaxID=2755281 RepID=UPI0030832394
MAGYCHSGKKCKFSHGTGVMDENDIAVAMLAARINRNPQAELALAIAASLLEKSSHEVNKVHLSQQKRTFHEKVCLLRSTLRMSKGEVHLTVDRNALFATSFLEIMYRPKKELKKKLFVHFKGEGGLDYGGLAREWFYLLSHELFTPKRGLFEFSDHQSYLLQIANNFSVDIYMKEAEDLECLLNEKNNNNNNNTANNNNNNSNNNDDDNKLNKSPSQELSPSNRLDASLSVTNEDVSNEPHLSLAELRSKMDSRYYLFLGRVLGLAVFHNHFVDAVFVNTFYRCLGGFPITLRDIEKLDEQLHRSLLWLLENNGVEELNMRFTIDVVVNERVRSVELLPGGRNKLVTDLNKEEYVSCLIDWRVHRETKAQLSALKSGFHEFIPEAKLKKFSEQEIEYLISGEAKIDTDDWEKNTIYKNCDREATIVTWFWQLITGGDEKFRYKVLQFVTGTQRIPTEGFQALQGSDGPRKFCIQRTADVHKLPSSHTCFNRLDLPDYESFEELKMKLELAVSGFQGFSDEK